MCHPPWGASPPGIPEGGPAAGGRPGDCTASTSLLPRNPDMHALAVYTPYLGPQGFFLGKSRLGGLLVTRRGVKHPEFGGGGSSSGFIKITFSQCVPCVPFRTCVYTERLYYGSSFTFAVGVGTRQESCLTSMSRTARRAPSGRKLCISVCGVRL